MFVWTKSYQNHTYNYEATIPSNYDNVEDIAQEATTLHNAVEVSLSQEEMQKKDTESTCKTFRKFNTC